jgi:hypothetical protein
VNVHAPSEKKSDDTKNSFYNELEQVIHHFPKHHIKILLGDFNGNWREKIYSNRQLGMRIYIRTVIIMVLEY